jgi:hypothetical protein
VRGPAAWSRSIDEQQTGAFDGVDCVRHIGRHADNRAGRRGDRCPPYRPCCGAFDDQDEGFKWRRVLGQSLAGIEREHREIATGRLRQYPAGNPVVGWRDE